MKNMYFTVCKCFKELNTINTVRKIAFPLFLARYNKMLFYNWVIFFKSIICGIRSQCRLPCFIDNSFLSWLCPKLDFQSVWSNTLSCELKNLYHIEILNSVSCPNSWSCLSCPKLISSFTSFRSSIGPSIVVVVLFFLNFLE